MIGEVQGPVITLEYFNGNFTTIGSLPSDIWALGITVGCNLTPPESDVAPNFHFKQDD